MIRLVSAIPIITRPVVASIRLLLSLWLGWPWGLWCLRWAWQPGGIPRSMSPGLPGLPPRIDLSWAIAYSTWVKDLFVEPCIWCNFGGTDPLIVEGRPSLHCVPAPCLKVFFLGVDSCAEEFLVLLAWTHRRSDISRSPLRSLRPEGLLLPPVEFLTPGSNLGPGQTHDASRSLQKLRCRVVAFLVLGFGCQPCPRSPPIA